MMLPSANWGRERISTMDLLATFAQISEVAQRPVRYFVELSSISFSNA